jgi:cytochrome c biogenesis protein CcmG, thiol:disulfide interchange protein DsbE
MLLHGVRLEDRCRRGVARSRMATPKFPAGPGVGRQRAARRWLQLVTIVLVVSTIGGACQSPGASDAGPAAINATTAGMLPRTVSALPSFDFATYERLMYELRGTPVVVNIWASWCIPCRREAPILVAATKRYGDSIQFLGVDYQDQRGPAADFSAEFHIPYPSVFDGSGEIHDKLGFVGLPDTLFYDADGKIISTYSGPLTTEALRQNLERLVSA